MKRPYPQDPLRRAPRRRTATSLATLTLALLSTSCTVPPVPGEQAQGWTELESGLDLGVFRSTENLPDGTGLVRVVRIDPRRFELRLLNASATSREPLTAREWCLRHGLVAAINASMYQADYRTSVSLMRTRSHVNNPRRSKDRAILAFDPREPRIPPVRIIDLECEDFDRWAPKYGTLVQSIRMFSCKHRNVWSKQPRRWSAAAIGTDAKGRVLFVHARSRFRVHDLIDLLVTLPLELDRLMYAEGGPEAQLYVRGGGAEYEFVGAFEAAPTENESGAFVWPIPNVVGVARREPAASATAGARPDRGPGRGRQTAGVARAGS